MRCVICGHESDNEEDFNDSSPGRPLCKIRGRWDCVRDWYTIHFMKDSQYLAGEIEDKVKEIKMKAELDRKRKMKERIERKSKKSVPPVSQQCTVLAVFRVLGSIKLINVYI